MRILNSKRNEKVFQGLVLVCGRQVYIDTKTGEGFHDMFNAMAGYINVLANIIVPITESVLEAKQEVYLVMLEGLALYNISLGASLSTFLYRYTRNKMFDLLKKTNRDVKRPMDSFNYIIFALDNIFTWEPLSVDLKLDLAKRVSVWDDKWQNVMVRLFVEGEKVKDVATSMGMSPWGLTRAVRRKLKEARNI